MAHIHTVIDKDTSMDKAIDNQELRWWLEGGIQSGPHRRHTHRGEAAARSPSCPDAAPSASVRDPA